jgi:cytochrome c-type biogenesis protein CcmF
VACVAFGLRGLGPLLAFGLAAFAGAAALRQLGLSVRAARRGGEPAWRALLGRSNGGMVVHIGVVLVAVGFAASSSYGHRAQFRLAPGQSATLAGHSVTYLGTTVVDHGNKKTTSAQVRVDGGKVYEPALHQFPFGSQAIGSPSVRTGPFSDVYLTLVVPPDADGVAVIGVNVQPLIMWLWGGGTVMGFGTFLAAWPGRRRRRPARESEPAVAEPGPVRPEPAAVP